MDSETSAAETSDDGDSVEAETTRCFDSNHSQEITETLNKFRLTDSKYCDVVLEAEGETFNAHKCILGSMSEYFDKMFNVDFQEKYKHSITINEVPPQILKVVLDFIYTSKVELDESNAYQVLAAAEYFMIHCLKKFCCQFLGDELKPENSLKIWRSACKYNASELKKQSEKYISDHFLEISKVEDFFHLNYEELEQVVLFKDNNDSNEENAYSLIEAWVEHNKEERNKHFPKLFSLLDSKKISEVFFSHSVLKKGVIRKHDEIYENVVERICGRFVEDHQKRMKMAMYIQPSTSLLVVNSKGMLRKYDTRSNFQEPVSSREFECFEAVVKMQGYVFLLGINMGNKVVKFNLNSPEDGWEDVASLPEGSKLYSATVMDDSWIVAVSYNTTYIYDSSTAQWTCFAMNWYNLNSCLVASAGLVFEFRHWYCCDVVEAEWEKVTNNVDGVISNGVSDGQNIYLFKKGDGLDVIKYNAKTGHRRMVNTIQNSHSVKDACLVDGRIIAVILSDNEGSVLKELNETQDKWRVITGVNLNDFARIFPLND